MGWRFFQDLKKKFQSSLTGLRAYKDVCSILYFLYLVSSLLFSLISVFFLV